MTIQEKLQAGETVFIKCDVGMNDIHDVVAKLLPQSDYTIIKQKGGSEYSVKDDTDIATDCRMFGTEITESEYKAH